MTTRVKDWRPTQFDPPGAFLPDRAEWFVRAARIAGRGGWTAFAKRIKTVGGLRPGYAEVHTYTHWSLGTVEVLITLQAAP